MPELLLAMRCGGGGDWRGERREEGRRGQGLFPAPSRPPPQAAAGASCVVTMQIAAIAEINKGVGRGERDSESIATSAKSRTIQSTQGKTRENLRTSQPGLDRFQKRRERETVREAESAHCNCKSLQIWSKKKKKFSKKPAIGQEL